MRGQNVFPSFAFTPHTVSCFGASGVVKRDILWRSWGVLKWGTLLNNGVAKHHLIFSFPQRWRRSQRCCEYPSKHRRDRCKRRALLNYFNHRCFYHISQPDTPSGMLGFVFVLHLMFFQQAAGIHIQMLSKAIHCHIQP